MRSVAILGAGAIGCFLGAVWAQPLRGAGCLLTLIGRARMVAAWQGGLHVQGRYVTPQSLQLTQDAAALGQADLILVCAKSTALDGVIADLAAHARPGTPVLSLMNGVSPVERLAHALPDHPVLAGMVPFNVAWDGPDGLHRSSRGAVVAQDHPATRALATLVADTAAPLALSADPLPILRGKLLLNLVNPINALVGGPLYDVLSVRDGRRVFAAALAEGLATYRAAGLAWRKVGPFSPRLGAVLLRLPDMLFNTLLLPIQRIDRVSMTSMAQDLAQGRPTEIDALNGDILRIAAAVGVAAPVNAGLVRMIAQAPPGGPRLSPRSLRMGVLECS